MPTYFARFGRLPIVAVLLLCALSPVAMADERGSAQALWDRIHSLSAQDSWWLKDQLANNKNYVPFTMSPYSDDLWKARGQLNILAKSGDRVACYYSGALAYEDGRKAESGAYQKAALESYKVALQWLRPLAVDDADPDAQRLLAVMFKDGLGLPKSPLNAIDWFYKSEESFRKLGQREAALEIVDRMRELDADHPLTKKAYAVTVVSGHE